MQMDEAGRRRFMLLGGLVGLLLGGMMLSGLIQRFLVPDSAAMERADAAERAAMAADARRARAIRKRMSELGRGGRWDEAVAVADRALAEKEGSFVRGLRAEALLISGDWEKARRDMADALTDRDAMLNAARLQYLEDPDGYRRLCERLIGEIKPAEFPALYANNAAWMTVLGPGGLDDYATPLLLAEKAVAGAAPEERPNFLNTLGGVLLRAGRTREAIARLNEAEKALPSPFNWAFLALAHQQAGDAEQARAFRGRLQKRVRDTYGTLELQESRHELLLFLHEVEAAVP